MKDIFITCIHIFSSSFNSGYFFLPEFIPSSTSICAALLVPCLLLQRPVGLQLPVSQTKSSWFEQSSFLLLSVEELIEELTHGAIFRADFPVCDPCHLVVAGHGCCSCLYFAPCCCYVLDCLEGFFFCTDCTLGLAWYCMRPGSVD